MVSWGSRVPCGGGTNTTRETDFLERKTRNGSIEEVYSKSLVYTGGGPSGGTGVDPDSFPWRRPDSVRGSEGSRGVGTSETR